MPTHGHGDHYNGLKHMQDTYGGPVYIGSADAAALSATNPRNATAFAGSATNFITTTALPTEVLTPQTITVDDQTLTVLSTPGHTPGHGVRHPAGPKLGDKTYKLVYWGGTGTPTTLPLAKTVPGRRRAHLPAGQGRERGRHHPHPSHSSTALWPRWTSHQRRHHRRPQPVPDRQCQHAAVAVGAA